MLGSPFLVILNKNLAFKLMPLFLMLDFKESPSFIFQQELGISCIT